MLQLCILPAPGESVLGFVIESELARGAMGVVYRGREEKTSRAVAIKVQTDVRDRESNKRFAREGSALARVRHPNIVGILASGEVLVDGNKAFVLVMEFVRGSTFRTWMQKHAELQGHAMAEVLLPFVRALSEGLHVVHSHGLVHRDVKPENIVLVDDQIAHPVLVDFGLSKDLEASRLTVSGQILGTPRYMSPEQLRAQTPSAATDQYALAVVLYEALAARPPFTGVNIGELVTEILTSSPRPIDGVSGELLQTLLRALGKRSEERFASMLEFGAAFSSCAAFNSRESLAASSSHPRTVLDGRRERAVAMPASNRVRHAGTFALSEVDPVPRVVAPSVHPRAIVLEPRAPQTPSVPAPSAQEVAVAPAATSRSLVVALWALVIMLAVIAVLLWSFVRAPRYVVESTKPAEPSGPVVLAEPVLVDAGVAAEDTGVAISNRTWLPPSRAHETHENPAATPVPEAASPLMAARDALRAGRADNCVSILDQHLSSGGAPVAFLLRGDCNVVLERLESARHDYERFCLVQPQHPEIARVRSWLTEHNGYCP